MRGLYLTLLLLITTIGATAQISIQETTSTDETVTFENEMRTTEMNADYFSEALYRAERRAIRQERNKVEFSANLHGSLTAFSQSWQAAGDNTVTILANMNFLHTFNKGRFTLTNTATAKFGYNRMKTDFVNEDGSTFERGTWFKNVDEISISTAPQWAMVRNWTYGANIKFRTQFARGYSARTDRYNGNAPVSNFMTPGYLDASVGFTYTVPLENFPLKVNLSPLAMSATYLTDQSVATRYGVPEGQRQKYEGGLSIQLDFDKTWGRNGWLRYRTTAYSFYGWITDLSSKANFAPTETTPEYVHVVPTLRWENTIDIKATQYLSTQIYVQLYYNRAEINKLQVQSMLSVGLTYTFKNKE